MRSRLSEGKSLRPSARTLWEIQAFTQKPPVEVSTNLYTYIRDKAKNYIENSRKARESITDMPILRARQEAVRAAFLRCIGGLPENASFISATVSSRIETKAFCVENVILETRPNRSKCFCPNS